MIKFICSLVLSFIFISVANPYCCKHDINKAYQSYLDEKERIRYESELLKFANHLGFIESRNNWQIVNSIGCIGEYQFSHNTLKHLGYNIKPCDFRKNPEIFPPDIQFEALLSFMKINDIYINNYLSNYIDSYINGIKINKAGLLAGMHIGGMKGVELFLVSNGSIDRNDIYGTKISDYIKLFNIYNL